VTIGDLTYRRALGVAKPEGIWLDASGAGLGWSAGSGQWSVVDSQWSVVSGQLFGTDFTQRTTAHGQLPTAGYDLLTVLTHELGHVLGHADLDPQHHPDHLMAAVLQPGTARVEIADDAHDSELATLLGPAASKRGPQWVAGAERDSADAALIVPEASGSGALVVDRVIDDLLRDDQRVSQDAWQDEEDDDYERLLVGDRGETYDDIDDFFAQL
jgi:hypothetical protein